MWLTHVWEIGILTPIRQRETPDHLIPTTFICCWLRCTRHRSTYFGYWDYDDREDGQKEISTRRESDPGHQLPHERVTLCNATEKIMTFDRLLVWMWTWGIIYNPADLDLRG
ncbi:hypothetical protein CHS0354_038881, partial [Potamilus streckersoni]